jgi:hypothetical protein
MIKRNYTIVFILFLLPTIAFTQSIGIGGTITQSIDLLQTPVQNSERVFVVNGNAFTAYPALYLSINDETSITLEAGAGFAFMSKNNSKGEVDRDLLYTFPVLAKLNFGSAANTGNDCTTWGWYIGAGRQWRSAIDIHGTSTTAYVTYFGEIGGTINATAPADIGAFARFGFGANTTRGIQIGLTFSYNHKPNGCK